MRKTVAEDAAADRQRLRTSRSVATTQPVRYSISIASIDGLPFFCLAGQFQFPALHNHLNQEGFGVSRIGSELHFNPC